MIWAIYLRLEAVEFRQPSRPRTPKSRDNAHCAGRSETVRLRSRGSATRGCRDRREFSVEGPRRGNPFGWLIGHGGDPVVVVVVVEYRQSGGFCCSCDYQIHRLRPAMLTGPS